MKVSVSLPEEDVEFLDTYAAARGIASRSATVHKAVRLLRASELGSDYEDAWQEWVHDGDDQAWESTLSDGLR
jgi:Arc/MetJ-type ribon-helix-helix transcriptional regulator